jgi:hypothetical protein
MVQDAWLEVVHITAQFHELIELCDEIRLLLQQPNYIDTQLHVPQVQGQWSHDYIDEVEEDCLIEWLQGFNEQF